MFLSDFDYELPKKLIAQEPISPRDNSKMLLIDNEDFKDKHFYDLPNLISKNDLILCNNTKVIASKLYGKRNTTSIQVTLHKVNNNGIWSAFALSLIHI